MVNLPDYTQITLTDQNLLPLEDLGASAGYDRSLLLPDDLPGVIALPWAIGPTRPRVNQCQADGSLNVFVKGQSGGGGTFAPLRPTFSDGPTDVTVIQGEDNLLDLDVDVTSLWAYFSVSATVQPAGGADSPSIGFLQVFLQQASTNTLLAIASVPFGIGGGSPLTPTASTTLVMPPGGIDFTAAFPSPGTVNMIGRISDVSVIACIASTLIVYRE